MDDLNEMANLHSAGATVRHISPFSSLPSHKNDADLTDDFIKKWVIPFYMKIGSYGDNTWVETIKEIKHEITPEICLQLLGEFNWRTRLVGAYFAAVKGYTNLIDIIGVHLLKSEVCCVGHVYALVFAFFNTPESREYLIKYLGYYLTTPRLYFDQDWVMKAILYLDKVNGTNNFNEQLIRWNQLEEIRAPMEAETVAAMAKMLEEGEDKDAANKFLESVAEGKNKRVASLTTQYFDDQMPLLTELNQYKP
jgi:uncharacterized protein DUF6000